MSNQSNESDRKKEYAELILDEKSPIPEPIRQGIIELAGDSNPEDELCEDMLKEVLAGIKKEVYQKIGFKLKKRLLKLFGMEDVKDVKFADDPSEIKNTGLTNDLPRVKEKEKTKSLSDATKISKKPEFRLSEQLLLSEVENEFLKVFLPNLFQKYSNFLFSGMSPQSDKTEISRIAIPLLDAPPEIINFGFNNELSCFDVTLCSEEHQNQFMKKVECWQTKGTIDLTNLQDFLVQSRCSLEETSNVSKFLQKKVKWLSFNRLILAKKALIEVNTRKARLNDGALRELKIVNEKWIKNGQDGETEATKFISKFGSHVLTGSVAFGGCLLLSSVLTCENEFEIGLGTSVALLKLKNESTEFFKQSVFDPFFVVDLALKKKIEQLEEGIKFENKLSVFGGDPSSPDSAMWLNSLQSVPVSNLLINENLNFVSLDRIILNYSNESTFSDCFQFACLVNNAIQTQSKVQIANIYGYDEYLREEAFKSKTLIKGMFANHPPDVKFVRRLSESYKSFKYIHKRVDIWRDAFLNDLNLSQLLVKALKMPEVTNSKECQDLLIECMEVIPLWFPSFIVNSLWGLEIVGQYTKNLKLSSTLKEVQKLFSMQTDYNLQQAIVLLNEYAKSSYASQDKNIFYIVALGTLECLNRDFTELNWPKLTNFMNKIGKFLDMMHVKREELAQSAMFTAECVETICNVSSVKSEQIKAEIIKFVSPKFQKNVKNPSSNFRSLISELRAIGSNKSLKKVKIDKMKSEEIFNFKMIKVDDELENFTVKTEDMLMKIPHFISNGIAVLDLKELTALRRKNIPGYTDFESENTAKITPTNYIHHFLFRLVNKQNSFMNVVVESDKSKPFKQLHPLDLLMLTVSAADYDLRKVIMNNLMHCYQAMPLLMPDGTMNLHHVGRQYKYWSENNQVFSSTIAEMTAPIISFMKFGEKLDIHKEEIINKMFFPRAEIFIKASRPLEHCLGSVEIQTTKTVLKEVKSDESKNKQEDESDFNRNMTILNVRKNGLVSLNKDFVLQASNFLVLIAGLDEKTIREMEQYLKRGGVLFHVCTQEDTTEIVEELLSKYEQTYHLYMPGSDAVEYATFIMTDLKKSFKQLTESKWKSLAELVSENKVKTDQTLAIVQLQKIVQRLSQKGSKNLEIKGLLQKPCQKISLLQKDILRQKHESKKEQMLKDKYEIEAQVFKILQKDLHPEVIEFTSLLLSLNMNCLKIFFDCLSAEIFKNSDEFTLTHYLREVTYACEFVLMRVMNNGGFVDQVAKRISELVFEGYSHELINGECTGFNPNFTKKVFGEIVSRAQNSEQKMFVLSVLGCEKSGKSTMLNTMFNLNFGVSAAKCTRGINIQMIPVRTNISSKCNYILVMDTEGLRSAMDNKNEDIKDADQSRAADNELSALVTCASDLTLINNNHLGDGTMQDVLEIVCSSIIRLKKMIDVDNRWIMVYQRVDKKEEARKSKPGIDQTIQRRLDDVVKFATQGNKANEDNTQSSSFTQTINFDFEKDSFYISGLTGDFSISPHYVADILNVKDSIFERLQVRGDEQEYHKLENVLEKIEKVHGQVIADNFNYCFYNLKDMQNNREVEKIFEEVGTDLLNRYNEASVKLHEDMEAAADNDIGISTKENNDSIQKKQELMISKFKDQVNKYHSSWREIINKLTQELMAEQSNNSNYLKHVDSYSYCTLMNCEWLVGELQKQIEGEIRKRYFDNKLKYQSDIIEAEIAEKAREEGLRIYKENIQLTESETENVFNLKVWEPCLSRIQNDENLYAISNVNIDSDVNEELNAYFSRNYRDQIAVYNQLSISGLVPSNFINKFRYLFSYSFELKSQTKSFMSQLKSFFVSEKIPEKQKKELESFLSKINSYSNARLKIDKLDDDQIQKINNLISVHENLIKAVDSLITKILETQNYKRQIIVEFIDKLWNEFSQSTNCLKTQFTFNSVYYFNFVFYACQSFKPKLNIILKNYRDRLDIKKGIEKKKPENLNLFKLKCKNASSIYLQNEKFKAAAMKSFESFIQDPSHLKLKFSRHIKDKISGKKQLIAKMLCLYLNNNDLNSIINIFKNFESLSKDYLRGLVSQTDIQSCLEERSPQFFERLNEYLEKVISISDFSTFEKLMNYNEKGFHMTVPIIVSKEEFEIEWNQLKMVIIKMSQSLKQNNTDFEIKPNHSNVTTALDAAVEECSKMTIGCTQTCPFCHAVCDSNNEFHAKDNEKGTANRAVESTRFHSCSLHCPQVLQAWRLNGTTKGWIKNCPLNVASEYSFILPSVSDKYSNYANHFPSWIIDPKGSALLDKFWFYIIWKFKDQILKKYELTEYCDENQFITSEHRNMTDSMAIKELERMM